VERRGRVRGDAPAARGGHADASVGSFAELHDYVDANEYGGAAESWEEGTTDEFCRFWNRVQNEVDAWLRAGLC